MTEEIGATDRESDAEWSGRASSFVDSQEVKTCFEFNSPPTYYQGNPAPPAARKLQ